MLTVLVHVMRKDFRRFTAPQIQGNVTACLTAPLNRFQQKCFAWNANRKKTNGSTFVDKETCVPTAFLDVRCWKTKRERFPRFTLCSPILHRISIYKVMNVN